VAGDNQAFTTEQLAVEYCAGMREVIHVREALSKPTPREFWVVLPECKAYLTPDVNASAHDEVVHVREE